jgi:hypothetical protein
LPTCTLFQATDPPDKIYAVLGLSRDAASFAPHVSYADPTAVVFAKFAKLFIERGEGIEVLLQAGLRDDNDEWSSWIPHWDDLEQVAEAESARSTGKYSTRMRIREDGRALEVKGTILDEIKTINTTIFETLEVTTSGVSMTRLIKSLVAGFRMAFDTATSGNPEKMFERLFDVLAQPGELTAKSTPQDPGGPASTPAKPPSGTMHDVDADQADDSETRILRTGFHEFLNYVMTLRTQLSDLSEGVTQLTSMKSPNEYQAFLKRAMNTTGHRRLCVTQTGRIGSCPRGPRWAIVWLCLRGVIFILYRGESGACLVCGRGGIGLLDLLILMCKRAMEGRRRRWAGISRLCRLDMY